MVGSLCRPRRTDTNEEEENMKEIRVLLLNGSPAAQRQYRRSPCDEMEAVFAAEWSCRPRRVQLGKPGRIRGLASACGACAEAGPVRVRRCRQRAGPQAGGRRTGWSSPARSTTPSHDATLVALPGPACFYSTPFDKTMKVGARRGVRPGAAACPRRPLTS